MNSKSKSSIAQKPPVGNLKRVIPTKPYNPAQRGRPYMARVRWSNTGQKHLEWCFWIGKDGQAGRFEPSFNAGDIFMAGQKSLCDWEKPRKPWFFLALPDGSFQPLAHEINAQEIYWSNLQAEESHLPEDEVRPLARLSDGELKARYDEVKAEIQMRRAERGLA